MTFVILSIIVATTVWVGIDASKRDWGNHSFANSVLPWILGSLFLWIVIFPLYLLRRRRVPLKGQIARGSSTTSNLERHEAPCPFCGEQILTSARKCKHCGEWLSRESAQEGLDTSEQSRLEPVRKR
jgi:predicted RNA-binding Zn-ribbon protein involved in translation (DUF1610 family)